MARRPELPTTIGDHLRQALIDRAIKRGQHADIGTWRTVCDGCRDWVAGIYSVAPDGRRLCRACSPEEKR